MTKRKYVMPSPQLPTLSLRLITGSAADLDAVFYTLTTPYNGRWHVRAYHNNQIIRSNDGGHQQINLYFDDTPITDNKGDEL